MQELFHLYVIVFLSGIATSIVVPSITDVTMSALCPGQDRCSLAIYLSGFQQAVIGLGSVIMMPLLGNLSDVYGRKVLLTIPMTLTILPLVILAWSRDTNFFYAYYVLRTLTATICDGSVNCLALAYVADNVAEQKRISVFGVVTGIGLAAFVCASLAARFLSTALTFQVAAFSSMVAVVYMRIFLPESVRVGEDLTMSMLKGRDAEAVPGEDGLPRKAIGIKRIPSVRDIVCLLKTSKTFSQAAVVAFFHSLAEGGMQASALYYLKARFHFNKNQYADLLLMAGVAAMTSQLVLMPFLTPFVQEEILLSIGLSMACVNMMVYSSSWAAWVPYATTVLILFAMFVPPCLRCIVSKQVGANEQGKAQGCISGITSLANIISPLIFSPLTGMSTTCILVNISNFSSITNSFSFCNPALFLSENAPFSFPGFSIFCAGFAAMVAFFQSTKINTAATASLIVDDTNSEA